MDRVLDLEQPDLVVFTGDVLGGQGHKNARDAWAATAPLVARDLRWCAVFGNHDDECDASRAELLAMQRQIPGCLTRPAGAGFRHGQLLPAPAFFDRPEPGRAPLLPGQQQLRRNRCRRLRLGARRPDPLAQPHPAGAGRRAGAGLPAHPPARVQRARQRNCLGEKNEPVCCPRLNTGLFAALHLAGNVRGVFAGHDHVNDYDGTLHAIRL